MLPDYAASVLCKFYCNGCFPLAPVVFPLCDFFLVHFAGLVKKRNHPARALFKFGHSLFLACKAGCKPDVLEGGFVPFCVGSGGSLINIAMQTGSNAFVIASSIGVPCRHDSAVHLCQLGIGDYLCWRIRRRAKHKWEPGVDLTVASPLEFVVVVYGQEPTDCWGFDAVCAARVDALMRHFNLDDKKDFGRCGSAELVGTLKVSMGVAWENGHCAKNV